MAQGFLLDSAATLQEPLRVKTAKTGKKNVTHTKATKAAFSKKTYKKPYDK